MNKEHDGILLPFKLIMVLGGLILGLLVARIFLLPCRAENHSMEPAVKTGSCLLILKTATPRVGDVVLIDHPKDPGKTLLLRVTAADEARVEMRNKIFYINGRKFTPPWKRISRDERILPLHFTTRDIMPPLRLRRGEYFLTADNADRGYDSRYFGPVHKDAIIGKVIYIY